MPQESHLGITVSDIFGDLAERAAEPHYRRVLASGATARFEVANADLPNRPQGGGYWGLNFNFSIRDRAERITHMGIMVVEVTQQRKLQRLLRELAGELHGSKSEEGFWYGRKIHDCIGQYDAALEASFDVLVRNPASGLEQLACSIDAWTTDCPSYDRWFLRYRLRYLSMRHVRSRRNSRQGPPQPQWCRAKAAQSSPCFHYGLEAL
jgi:hypothetical protein